MATRSEPSISLEDAGEEPANAHCHQSKDAWTTGPAIFGATLEPGGRAVARLILPNKQLPLAMENPVGLQRRLSGAVGGNVYA